MKNKRKRKTIIGQEENDKRRRKNINKRKQ